MSSQIELLEKNLARLIDWIGKHDTKASVVLGIDTAMLGVLGTLAGKKPELSRDALACLAAVALLLAISLVCIYVGNFPRIKASRSSVLFFATIADFEMDSYAKTIRNLTREDYMGDLLDQCHIISRILKKKFQYLQWAYLMLFLSIPFWAFSVYILGL